MSDIAGHSFDEHGRCSCGRAWVDIRNTLASDIGQQGIAHRGALNDSEYSQIAARREAEDARLSNATAAVAAGAG